MKWLAALSSAIILSLVIAFSLFFVTKLGLSASVTDGEIYVQTFSPQKPKPLSDLNLVDFLLQLPLQTNIHRAEWGQSILSLDLTLRQTSTKDQIYGDLFTITHLALHGTTNVRRVLIRVLMTSNHEDVHATRLLLVAVDADRNRDIHRALSQDKENVTNHDFPQNIELYLKSAYRMNFTPLWKQILE